MKSVLVAHPLFLAVNCGTDRFLWDLPHWTVCQLDLLRAVTSLPAIFHGPVKAWALGDRRHRWLSSTSPIAIDPGNLKTIGGQ